jgi:hypothetical protein
MVSIFKLAPLRSAIGMLEWWNNGTMGFGLRLGEENGEMVYWEFLLNCKIKEVNKRVTFH